MQTDVEIESNIGNAIKKKSKHFIENHLDGSPEDCLKFYKAIE